LHLADPKADSKAAHQWQVAHARGELADDALVLRGPGGAFLIEKVTAFGLVLIISKPL